MAKSSPKPLSMKEKNVLEFLEIYMRERGVSPTYQEICQHFGFASFNSVQRYLKQLQTKGYIQLPWANQKRAITLLHSASTLQDAAVSLHPVSSSESDGDDAYSDRDSDHVIPSVMPALLPSHSFSLPLLGGVAAGAPIESLQYDEFIDVPASLVRQPDRTFALRVQGQSMIEDGILDGDVILVQRQHTAQNGEIVVAVVDEEATVKHFYLHRGNEEEPENKVELKPANATMKSMWYESGEVQIRGIVVGLIRKF
jgi:repressor LexA